MSPILNFNASSVDCPEFILESNRPTELKARIELSLKKPTNCKISLEFIGLSISFASKRHPFQKQFVSKTHSFTLNSSCVTLVSLDLPALENSCIDSRGEIKYLLKSKITWSSTFRSHSLICLKPITVLLSAETRNALLLDPQPLSSHLPVQASKVDLVITLPKRVACFLDHVVCTVDIKNIPTGRSLRYVDCSLRTSIDLLNQSSQINTHHLPKPLDEIRDIPSTTSQGGRRLSVTSNWTRTFMLLVDSSIARPSVESPCFTIRSFIRVEVVLDDDPKPNIVLEIPISIIGDADYERQMLNPGRPSWPLNAPPGASGGTIRSSESASSLTVPMMQMYTPPASPDFFDQDSSFTESIVNKYQAIGTSNNRRRRPSLAQSKLDKLMSQLEPHAFHPNRQDHPLNKLRIDDQRGTKSLDISRQSHLLTYRAVYAYVPQNDDELELLLGDLISVKKLYEDGWAFGVNLSSGMEGVIPVSSMCEQIY